MSLDKAFVVQHDIDVATLRSGTIMLLIGQ